jgi:4'-phosphopantetheinyl transferase
MTRVRAGLLRHALDDVPPGDAWLMPHEAEVQAGLRFPKRRADWRLGRFTAKRAVAHWLDIDLSTVGVVAGDDGAPNAISADGRALPVAISITHREGVGVCAVADAPGAIGCDLELVEQRPAVFASDWFVAAERARADAGGPRVATVVWAAKEAAMKARHDGLRVPTHRVVVDTIANAPSQGEQWSRLAIDWRPPPAATLHGWWADVGEFVLVVVSDPALLAPTWL